MCNQSPGALDRCLSNNLTRSVVARQQVQFSAAKRECLGLPKGRILKFYFGEFWNVHKRMLNSCLLNFRLLYPNVYPTYPSAWLSQMQHVQNWSSFFFPKPTSSNSSSSHLVATPSFWLCKPKKFRVITDSCLPLDTYIQYKQIPCKLALKYNRH